MSKINTSRIVNLNYNKNTIKVNDETFEFGGDSTLLSLANGGGKSVLVQILSSLFVTGHYRNTPKRKFATYFKRTDPTYILTEWSLDNEAGHVLVGMAVRKNGNASAEDDSDMTQKDLEIVTFIHEYKKGNKYDIHNIPVVTKDDKGLKVTPMSKFKDMLDQIKGDRNYVFDYFEFSRDHHIRRYFERLKEYEIDHAEWESIISKINQDESGLSKLFSDSGTTENLLKKWMLPAISDKLNTNNDRLIGFRRMLESFSKQLSENKENIQKKEGIAEFRVFAEKICEFAQEACDAKGEFDQTQNSIANLYSYIAEHVERLEKENEKLEQLRESVQDKLKDVDYEELSYKYYDIVDELERLEKESEHIQMIIQSLQEQKNMQGKEVQCLECAQIHSRYKELSQEVQTLENKLDVATKSDEQKRLEMKDAGYTLNAIYSKEIKRLRDLEQEKGGEDRSKKEEIDKLEKTIEDMNKQIISLTGDISRCEMKMELFENNECDFREKFDAFKLTRNMFGEYEPSLVSVYEKSLEGRQEALSAELIKSESDKEGFLKKIEDIRKLLETTKIGAKGKEHALKDAQKALAELDRQCEEVLKLMAYIGVAKERLFDKEHIKKVLEDNIEQIEHEVATLKMKSDKLQKERDVYKSGKNIQLPKEFEKMLEGNGIPVIFGLTWLKMQPIEIYKKIELVRSNPFLPYSIIMNEAKINSLKALNSKVFTSFPIPIVKQEELDKGEAIAVENGIYDVGGLNFYMVFNEKLLDEAELKRLLDELDSKIDSCKKDISIKNREIRKFTADLSVASKFVVKKANLAHAQTEIETIQEDISKMKLQEDDYHKELLDLNAKAKEVAEQLENVKVEKRIISEEAAEYKKLKAAYKGYKKNLQDVIQFKESKAGIELKKNEAARKMQERRTQHDIIKRELQDLQTKLRDANRQGDIYKIYMKGNLISGDIEDIEAKYSALSKELGLEVKEYQELLKRAMKLFAEAEKQLSKKIDEYSLDQADFENISYDDLWEDKMDSAKKKVRETVDKIESFVSKRTDTEKSIAGKESDKSNQIELLRKEEHEQPKDKSLISNIYFDDRRTLLQEELKTCRKDMVKVEKALKKLTSSRDKLDEYKNFEVLDQQELNVDYSEVESVREELVRERSNKMKHMESKEMVLEGKLDELSTIFTHRDMEYFSTTIAELLSVKRGPDGKGKCNPEEIKGNIEMIMDVHADELERLATNLEKVKKEEELIVSLLLDYVKETYEHMDMIDDNSGIKIDGKPYKMLDIVQPEWSDDANILKMKGYVHYVIDECGKMLSIGKSTEETLLKEITTEKLYDTIVNAKGVIIKLYKIESSKVVPIRWNEVATNSGGEGFVSAFIILSSLLSYMRRGDNKIKDSKEEGKVLIMDNPFGQTSSEHLLKPLVEMANKCNTQLICFSALGGDSIYDRFDNIYVLNKVPSQLNKGVEIIESEHKKGSDNVSITSTRFSFEQQRQFGLEGGQQVLF